MRLREVQLQAAGPFVLAAPEPNPTIERAPRIPVLLLGAFVLSQAYTIPIRAVGPSWAIWPTVADILVVLLLPWAFRGLQWRDRGTSSGTRVGSSLAAILALAVLSFSALTLAGWNTLAIDPVFRRGVAAGAYQLYRLAQAAIIYRVARAILVNQAHTRMLRGAAWLAWVGMSAAILLTFIGWVDPRVFAAHLPPQPEVSGPWSFYLLAREEGLGATGYNHGYVAVQLLLLFSFWVRLRETATPLSPWPVLCTLAICALTGSRSGLAAAILLATILLGKTPLRTTIIALTLATAVMIAPSTWLPTGSVDVVMDRHDALLNPTNPANLAGRDQIWLDTVAFLNERPVRWFTGTGFGSAIDGPGHAHMLYLHLVVEVGILGLLGFGLAFARVLRALYAGEPAPHAIFWCMIALLFSSLAQETLYPVPAFGGFLALCSLALAVAPRRGPATEPRAGEAQAPATRTTA